MKKFFTPLLLAVAMTSPAIAQETLPETVNGFYRMTNAAFQEAMTSTDHFQLGGTLPNPANAASVFSVTTDKMFNFADEMEKLQALLEEGKITQEEYTSRFMSLMNVTSWKSGFYPITKFSCQGEDYIKLLEKLPYYADEALEYFLNNEADALYENYRGVLMFLSAVAIDVITPADLETEDTFRRWVERYLTRMREVADFGLYLHPIYTVPDEDDLETPAQLTGEYYFEFKTPIYVGSMEKAQTYINNLLSDNGTNPDAEQLDIWGSTKYYIFQEVAKDYPVGSPEYNFLFNLLDKTVMNTLYIIGESEEGGLIAQPLPDAFNSQGITISADDIARCTWKFEKIDSQSPFAVAPQAGMTDSEGRYYTSLNIAFPCKILSEGLEAFYATSVAYETGVPELVKINDEVIPAGTPVIFRSNSINLADNRLLPVESDATPISGNVMKGVYFAEPNNGSCVSLNPVSQEGPVFSVYHNTLPANSAYYDGSLSEVQAINVATEKGCQIYDLFGREVKNPSVKGIYIVNGKKVVK